LSSECKINNYNNGYTPDYWQWLGKYKNSHFNYFARHNQGRAIDYNFNSLGYRGHEHHSCPDISVFGSSFSFGVGVEFEKCWHQLLGNYKVNCYAPAGILVTNNNIIDHYHKTNIETGIVILQFREFRYNTSEIDIPRNVLTFVVDEEAHPNLFNLSWSSFIDKAEDHTHPGPLTHQSWAHQIKQKYNL
jgi:hypothetical protein